MKIILKVQIIAKIIFLIIIVLVKAMLFNQVVISMIIFMKEN